ncbi:centrosomal protein of 95 kDa-like [Argiope bruennichi]|uniref:centrosomal protein of 95 kDa-like n=1 Tax=Argiope bruennichi TaxID=94029 RepID=UPI00249489FE|nr:centrosomal protein of 95 kDa-like [Argiope bruennichi]
MSHSDFYDSSNSLEEKCLHLANKLILYCKRPCPRVQCLRDINSDLIVLLFESITNHPIQDLLVCTTKEEEAHNVQAVIDTLSLDILGISLSHITGEDVVAGNLVAICNLLEVLEGITLHLKIKKDKLGSRRSSLKRKICRKKAPILKVESKSSKHSSNGISDGGSEETSISTSGSLTLSTNSKFSISSPSERGSKKSTKTSVKDHFTQEKDLTTDYPISSGSASYSSPSNVTDIEKSEAIFQKNHVVEETDHITYPKKILQQFNSQVSSKPENKPHFRIEKVEQDRHLKDYKELSSKPGYLKRKISKCPHEKRTQQSVEKEQEVEELFERNLEKKVRVLLEKNSSYYPQASRLKRLQLQRLQKPIRKAAFTPCKKSFLLPHSLRRRSIRKTSFKRTSGHKNPISHTHQRQEGNEMEGSIPTGFIQELFEEFPGLKLPPQIINHIRKKYQQHLLKLHKQVKSCLLKKPKSQLQAEEAAKRQALLSELLKKNILEEQHLRELRDNRKYENKIKYRLRDARLQSAKMKQYCDEFHTEMRKKMQKRNFTEEQILEKIFMDALNIQKEQVNYLCEEVKEAEENDAKQHLAYLDALENLYQTQFAMLSEAISTEKKDKEVQVKAQEQVIRSMQREFQDELKKEIRFMQKVILECTEDTHFREMDAELYKEKLRRRYFR